MKHEALIIASFGSTLKHGQSELDLLVHALAAVCPEADVFRAVTSPTIRRILKARGEEVFSAEEQLEVITAAGYKRILIQPTLMTGGLEYERIQAAAANYPNVLTGKPLLADEIDIQELAECLREKFGDRREALVLIGHGAAPGQRRPNSGADVSPGPEGTCPDPNGIYSALQSALRNTGMEHTWVGTLYGGPSIREVIRELKQSDASDVLLVPLLLTAGRHVLRDMAGDSPESWKSQLEAEGFRVTCHHEGLGAIPRVRALYCRHLTALKVSKRA